MKLLILFRICCIDFVYHSYLMDTNAADLLHVTLMMQTQQSFKSGQSFSQVFPVIPIMCSFSHGSMFPLRVTVVSGQDPVAQNCFLN